MRTRALAAIAAGLLVACSAGSGDQPPAAIEATDATDAVTPDASSSPSPTPMPTPPATPTPSTSPTPSPEPEPSVAADGSCPALPARAAPPANRPAYDLELDVRVDEGLVVGRQHVRFVPDQDTDRIVFRLWANAPRIVGAGGGLTITSSDPPFEQVDRTTLQRSGSFPAGTPVEIDLTWELALPGPVNDRISAEGRAVRLGSFFPVLAWEPGVGWATEPPTSGFAEASLSVPADIEVDVTVPDDLTVIATGIEQEPGHWVATAVPDWAMSVADFEIVTGTANGGAGPVTVTVGRSPQVPDDPRTYLTKVVAVIEDFAGRFGPYPYPTYTLALTPTLSGGIEYPMHVMQGPDTIGRTTSHEVGHMYFYSLVPTHQGRDPWIDEGLASWAEARFEGTLPRFLARDIPESGRGRAGEPMTYWEVRQSAYYRSVYVQGVQAVGALGDPDLVDCALAHLVATQAHRITDREAAVAAIERVFPEAESVLAGYLG